MFYKKRVLKTFAKCTKKVYVRLHLKINVQTLGLQLY